MFAGFVIVGNDSFQISCVPEINWEIVHPFKIVIMTSKVDFKICVVLYTNSNSVYVFPLSRHQWKHLFITSNSSLKGTLSQLDPPIRPSKPRKVGAVSWNLRCLGSKSSEIDLENLNCIILMWIFFSLT